MVKCRRVIHNIKTKETKYIEEDIELQPPEKEIEGVDLEILKKLIKLHKEELDLI